MKIISRFKDYYDHQAHIYGADELIVYPRTEIHPGDFTFEVETKTDIVTDHMRTLLHTDRLGVDFLVVGGRVFPIHGRVYDREYGLVTKDHPVMVDAATQYRGYYKLATHRALEYFLEEKPESDAVMQLCREVGHPVFMILGVHFTHRTKTFTYMIDCKLPNLGKIPGFPGLYPAQQIYQDLSAYFAPGEPVIAPPSDLEKVTQHGFDKRVSFRHRS